MISYSYYVTYMAKVVQFFAVALEELVIHAQLTMNAAEGQVVPVDHAEKQTENATQVSVFAVGQEARLVHPSIISF